MTFTVTYRAKDGALADEVVEAASRTECVAGCKQRGITPMSIQMSCAFAQLLLDAGASLPKAHTQSRIRFTIGMHIRSIATIQSPTLTVSLSVLLYAGGKGCIAGA